MNIQLHDINDIVNKSKQGGGNYSPLEVALAEKAWTYYCTIARKSDEIQRLKDTFYAMYSAMKRNTELIQAMESRRKVELAAGSKAAFTAAARLDTELKAMMEHTDNH